MAGDPIARDVIIADNDYIIRGILRSVLEDRNFSVLPAVDGIEAIDLAVRTRACLVILDYMMPRLDGIATCAEIRCLPAYRNVPIIILTVFDDDSTRTAAQQAGATMFLTKPFRPIDLLQAVTDCWVCPRQTAVWTIPQAIALLSSGNAGSIRRNTM